jgi:DNA-binding XRE family transcriptional regulator/predicted RNase H-like HicB family nuclease
MEYRATITHEGSQTLAEFPDCHGCQTFVAAGENIESAASEALECWLESHLAHGEAPPSPKASSGTPIRLNAQLAVKLQLRWARNRKGFTQAQVAKLAGVSQQMVAKVENPDYSAGLDLIERIAKALGCDVNVQFRSRSQLRGAQRRPAAALR